MSHVPRRFTFCGYDGNRTNEREKKNCNLIHANRCNGNAIICVVFVCAQEVSPGMAFACIGIECGNGKYGGAFVYFNYAVQIDGFDGSHAEYMIIGTRRCHHKTHIFPPLPAMNSICDAH